MISPGKKLPASLALRIVRQGKEESLTLKQLLRRRTLVSVYMRNNTSACDRQNESLAAHVAEFDKLGYDLVAVSRDTCASHAKYAAKLGIGYTLVSDPDDTFSKAADAIVEKSMYGKKYLGPARAAYVLDKDGTVLAVADKVDTKDHAAQLRALIAAL
jgi:thioredoxin-dependent peroxiredoxin